MDRKQGGERGNDMQQRATGGTKSVAAVARTMPLYMGCTPHTFFYH